MKLFKKIKNTFKNIKRYNKIVAFVEQHEKDIEVILTGFRGLIPILQELKAQLDTEKTLPEEGGQA